MDAQNATANNQHFELLLASGRAFSMTIAHDGSMHIEVPVACATDAYAHTHVDTEDAHATMRTQAADEPVSQDSSPIDATVCTIPTMRTQLDTQDAHAHAEDAHDDLPPALAETLALFQGDAPVDKFSAQRDLDISVRAVQCRLHRLDVDYHRIEKQDTRGHYRLAQSNGANACLSPIAPGAEAAADQYAARDTTLADIPEQSAGEYTHPYGNSNNIDANVYSSLVITNRADRPKDRVKSIACEADLSAGDETSEAVIEEDWFPPELLELLGGDTHERPDKGSRAIAPEDELDDDDLDYYLADDFDEDEQETPDARPRQPTRPTRPTTVPKLSRAALLANAPEDDWITG